MHSEITTTAKDGKSSEYTAHYLMINQIMVFNFIIFFFGDMLTHSERRRDVSDIVVICIYFEYYQSLKIFIIFPSLTLFLLLTSRYVLFVTYHLKTSVSHFQQHTAYIYINVRKRDITQSSLLFFCTCSAPSFLLLQFWYENCNLVRNTYIFTKKKRHRDAN